MHHDLTLVTTIAVAFAVAFVLGWLATRFRLPPLIGYLIAGVLIGSNTPGYRADIGLAGQLAEIGVMLLMFGVGLHFSVADLLAVRRIALPGAVGQIVIATAIGLGVSMLWGWSLGAGLVLGLSLSVASTVVLLKALEERNAVATPNGRIAVGWLIVEDLAMVLALVLLPAVAAPLGGTVGDDHGAHGNLAVELFVTFVKVGAFLAIALLLGPRVMPWLLRQVARTGSRELFTLAILTAALGIAFGAAKLFGVSFALGAFFAGMVLSESDLSHRAAANSLPLQDAFAVLFFVSVGMLFDPSVILREPVMVVAVLLLIIVGKSLVALGIALALGYPVTTGLMVAGSLAQVGEFSFILAGLGISYGLMPAEGLNLILCGALLSITLNPLVFLATEKMCAAIGKSARFRGLAAYGAANFARLERDLDEAREKAAARAAEHKTFTPEELAQRFPMFAGLTAEQRDVLVLHFQSKTAQPGERIIRAGDEADAVYFISAGQVEVEVAGRRIKLGPGDFFGEMALISGAPRSADVTALDYSRFATLSERDFRRFLAKYPQIQERVAALAAERGEMNRKLREEDESKNPPA